MPITYDQKNPGDAFLTIEEVQELENPQKAELIKRLRQRQDDMARDEQLLREIEADEQLAIKVNTVLQQAFGLKEHPETRAVLIRALQRAGYAITIHGYDIQGNPKGDSKPARPKKMQIDLFEHLMEVDLAADWYAREHLVEALNAAGYTVVKFPQASGELQFGALEQINDTEHRTIRSIDLTGTPEEVGQRVLDALTGANR